MVVTSLSGHPCFKTLDPESCRVLDRHCTWLKTAVGQWLIGQTANDRDVYFVMTGRLRAVSHGVRQDLIFSDMEAGSFFGELAALDGGPRSLSVFAVNDSMVAKMPSAVFVETMYTHRPLGEAVVATLVSRNRAMTRRVGELGALDVRSRVHAELLRLAHPDRDDPKRAIILAPPNQSELASRINTRRETVSREINAMEREGLIERRRGAIVIKDALRLSARLRGDSRRRVAPGRTGERGLSARRVGQRLPPAPVRRPVPAGGRRGRRQEPEAGWADALPLLAEAGGVAQVSPPGGEAREREPVRLGGCDLRPESRAGFAPKRAGRQFAIHAAHMLGEVGQAQAPLRQFGIVLGRMSRGVSPTACSAGQNRFCG